MFRIKFLKSDSKAMRKAIVREAGAQKGRSPKGKKGWLFRARNQQHANRCQGYAVRLAKQKTAGKK